MRRQRTERFSRVTEGVVTRDTLWKLNSKGNAEGEKSHAARSVAVRLPASASMKGEIP